MCGSIQLIAYERSRASGHEGGWLSSATALAPTGTDDVRLQRSSDAEYQYVLLDEANHRIKNNLQIVQALLETPRRDTCNLEGRRFFRTQSAASREWGWPSRSCLARAIRPIATHAP